MYKLRRVRGFVERSLLWSSVLAGEADGRRSLDFVT